MHMDADGLEPGLVRHLPVDARACSSGTPNLLT